MNCDMFTVLCLRANGQFSCYCDAGHGVSLGEASAESDWTIEKLFAGRNYSLARAMFRRGYAPWGETCARCILLQRDVPFVHDRPTKWLQEVLFEPSFACALRCPSCPRAEQASTRAGPIFLSVDIWRRVLSSLREEGYRVGAFVSTGLGDPLTHPRFEDLMESIRDFFPTTPITISTNANYRFPRVFSRGAYPDRLLVSVDGLHQHSYEQYRIRGKVATVLEFMREARAARGPRPAVEWKYILFRHNDSDAELIAAQQKAEELDVDSLHFVFTHTIEKSLRYTPANVRDLPIVWRGAYPDGTCHVRFGRPESPALSPNDSAARPGFAGANRARIHIDSCHAWADRLIVHGWAMGSDGSRPRRVAIQLDDETITEARIGLVREDVWGAFPALKNRTAGFDAMFVLPSVRVQPRVTITVIYESAGGEIIRFPVDYALAR